MSYINETENNNKSKKLDGKPIIKINSYPFTNSDGKQLSEVIKYNQNNFHDMVIKKGKKILEENTFIKELNNIMKDKEFRDFYDKYFTGYTDIQTVILYMKLYQTLEKEYEKRFDEKIPEELMAYTLKEIFTDKNMRRFTMESFNNFMEKYEDTRKNQFLLDIFQKINCIEDIIKLE